MGGPERITRRRPHPSCAGTPGSTAAPAQFRAVREQGARVRTRRSVRPGGLVRSARCGPHGLLSTWMAVIHSVRLLGEPRTAEYPVPTSSDDWRRYMTVVLTDGGRYSRQRPPETRCRLNDSAFGTLADDAESNCAADAVTSKKLPDISRLPVRPPRVNQVTRRTSRALSGFRIQNRHRRHLHG